MFNKISQKHFEKFLYVILVLAILDFLIYGVSSTLIGGDALKGYVKDGIYYVYHSGKYIQISETTWYLSRIPGKLLNTSFSAAISAAILLIIFDKLGKDK